MLSRIRLVGFALIAALAGCGGSGESGGGGAQGPAMTDAQGFEAFVTSLDDFASLHTSMAKAFAAGSVPPTAELKRYAKYSYQLEGSPTIKDGTATFTVKVLQKDKEVAQKEWVAVLEDKVWKLKSAPLP